MAGIAAMYWIGSNGGFMGSEGVASVDLEIAIEVGSREAVYVTRSSKRFKPITKDINVFIPKGPCDKDTLRTALILFASDLFEACPSFENVKEELKGIKRIDFNMHKNVPPHFNDLFNESKSIDLKNVVDINMLNICSVDYDKI